MADTGTISSGEMMSGEVTRDQEPPTARPPGTVLRWLLLVLPAFLMLVGFGTVWMPGVPVASDPVIYLQRLRDLAAGGIPYVDPVLEHLPGMLVPMVAARLLAVSGNEAAYTLAFGILMVLCLWVSGRFLVGESEDPRSAAIRWLTVVAPLGPVVSFRNDPWVVMWTVIALSSRTPSRGQAVATWAAVMSKGWPVVLAPLFWVEGRRRLVVSTLAAGGLALAVMLTEGFRLTQRRVGVHSETVGGSLTGLVRAIRGEDLDVVMTTAAYIEVPPVVHLLGPALAILVFLAGLAAMWRASNRRHRVLAVGVLTAAVMLGSPLFSAQYSLWLAPFVALSRRRLTLLLGFAIGLQALHTVVAFSGLHDGSLVWWGGAALRNLMILLLAGSLAAECFQDPRRIGAERIVGPLRR